MTEKPEKKTISLEARAINLLSRREYSKAELTQRLRAHANSTEELEAVVNKLEQRKWLSDERAAEQWVQAKSSKYGDRYLKQLMREKGIDASLANDTIQDSADDEKARVKQVWLKKFGQKPDSPQDKMKQMRFLASRGFSMSSIQYVLSLDDGEIDQSADDEW
ncbi:recombination regulator RecX [Leeia sp. TBRC 13508]|uniref:Regulatory protein RecX n=1 Tax=Leeia speluncae TaxID=2884804 RepID=A0ABS8D9G7_9NEIS|nr:recombination regulator RecX [Leeia speluncae]MCB6184819.1 recombination regulator RecX [Leeia speluncae]